VLGWGAKWVLWGGKWVLHGVQVAAQQWNKWTHVCSPCTAPGPEGHVSLRYIVTVRCGGRTLSITDTQARGELLWRPS
jgi:hypothetical protein